MGNSHCLRFLPVNVSRQEFVSWKNYEAVLVLSSCQGTIIAVRSVAQIGETIFVENSLQKTQLLRRELILFTDILAGFTCCRAHPSESSTVFFFFFFFFSGHSLCSEHCSQLEHCVASTKVQQFFFYLFIYFQIKMWLRDSTSEK